MIAQNAYNSAHLERCAPTNNGVEKTRSPSVSAPITSEINKFLSPRDADVVNDIVAVVLGEDGISRGVVSCV